jgi:hypothetical protein
MPTRILDLADELLRIILEHVASEPEKLISLDSSVKDSQILVRSTSSLDSRCGSRREVSSGWKESQTKPTLPNE